MQLITELLADYRRLGKDDDDELPPIPDDGQFDLDGGLDLDADSDLELGDDGQYDLDSDQDIADAMPKDDEAGLPDDILDTDGQDGQEGETTMDGQASEEDEDPNRAGLIRTVKNAHMVYKRKTEDGSFEELWIYNISSLRDELDVRKAILSGTDIPVSRVRSPDGSQTYTLWSAGNAEMMKVIGLPN